MSDPLPEMNDTPDWYQEIFPGGARTGFFESMTHHALVFVARDEEQLVVSFDNLAAAGGRHLARDPWGGKFIRDMGWSHLGILANGPTWFRDAQLIARLESLRDEGFFARYKRVAFCGTSMGGFGALVFSRLAQSPTVIAFDPQSTLAGALVPFENRYDKGRRQDWSLPYSDAAGQLDHVARGYLVLDPFEKRDVQHIQRLNAPHFTVLNLPGGGHKTPVLLRRMDQLKWVMCHAIQGDLSEAEFYRKTRERKSIYMYKRNIENYLNNRGREALRVRFVKAYRARRAQSKLVQEDT